MTSNRLKVAACSQSCLLAIFLVQVALAVEPSGETILRVKNPDPLRLPTLSVWRSEKNEHYVVTEFPNAGGLVCDSWCYESDFDFLSCDDRENGRLELRHRDRRSGVVLVTEFIAEPGAVEVLCRPLVDTANSTNLPEVLPVPNLCWQVRRSPNFSSEQASYPEFFKRCFIFTPQGRTFLHETDRRPIPVRSKEDAYNNPPWVQMYGPISKPVPKANPQAWSDYSSDRFVVPICGVMSKDEKFIAALANDSATVIAQAWHDCLHNNPSWQPVDVSPEKRTWRLKIYALANNPNQLIARASQDFPRLFSQGWEIPGVQEGLPIFLQKAKDRQRFPMSWLHAKDVRFSDWRNAARSRVVKSLLAESPRVPFEPTVISEIDRGTHIARKITFNLNSDNRVLALMTIPKGVGPFPAVLLLHDHGAKFDIGKEKVIEPWEVPKEKLESAKSWVDRYYGGRFLGDELARRGYVCISTDALNWSDRGGGGFDGQQALASNLLHLGMSFAGVIAHEDIASADFLAEQREVDSKRIVAMGLSMGGFRTWQLAALSDRIAGGCSICWIATAKGLMVPGNNQTRGQSAFTMTHPGLLADLDYPDIASIACPKPMLFYAGRQDPLFPVTSVEDAFDTLRKVWESQGAGAHLEVKIWDVPHLFNQEMQEAAFQWLDREFKSK